MRQSFFKQQQQFLFLKSCQDQLTQKFYNKDIRFYRQGWNKREIIVVFDFGCSLLKTDIWKPWKKTAVHAAILCLAVRVSDMSKACTCGRTVHDIISQKFCHYNLYNYYRISLQRLYLQQCGSKIIFLPSILKQNKPKLQIKKKRVLMALWQG